MNEYRKGKDCVDLGQYYSKHVLAMTAENLHEKHEIAEELANRDLIIEQLQAENVLLRDVMRQAAEAPGKNWLCFTKV